MHSLTAPFYRRDDVVAISRELIGKVLCSRIDGVVAKAVIIETEAYEGPTDRASHAWNNRRTKRTEPMFREGGVAYVYLCYGIHHMFNVVTGPADVPHAILVRAGEALLGLDAMLARRGRDRADRTLLGGPGSLGKAMGITTDLTGTSLTGRTLWIEDHGIAIPEERIESGPRVGIDYAGDDALLPYRFKVRRDWLGEQLVLGRGGDGDRRLDPIA